MTTIAWDGEILAADSMQTCDSLNCGAVTKIFRLADGRWMAGAGRTPRIQQMRIWLDGGPAPEFKDDGENPMIIVVDKNGKAVQYDGLLTPFEVPEYYTAGSGDMPALALLNAGMTAVQAVRGAIGVDINSGGPVRWVRPGWTDVAVEW